MTDSDRHYSSCPSGFDQTMLTGYLDGELTQAGNQKVENHLLDCRTCHETFTDLKTNREVSMNTQFVEPEDDQWKEIPRGAASATFRGLGWLFIVLWAVSLVGFILWQVITGPENIWEKLLVFGALSGFALLLLSVLIDRLKQLKTDRYREVEK